jgi:hypothetical protein
MAYESFESGCAKKLGAENLRFGPLDRFYPFMGLATTLVVGVLFDLFVFRSDLLAPRAVRQLPELCEIAWLFDVSPTSDWRLLDFGGRALWGVFGLLQTMVLIVAIGTFFYKAAVLTRHRTDWLLLSILSIMGVAALIFVHYRASDGVPGQVVRYALEGTQGTEARDVVEHALDIGNFMAVMLIFAGGLATVCVCDCKADDEGIDELCKRVKTFKTLLTLASASLTVAVLQVGAQYHWAASLVKVTKDSPLNPVQDFASLLTVAFGAFFSFLMVSLFVPAAFVLNQRAESIAKARGVKSEERRAWLARHELDISLATTYIESVKLLYPLLAALPFSLLKS